MANKTSQHILSTSINLLGFCLFILTSLHLSDKSQNSYADEFTSIVALLLTITSVLSFLSIKAINEAKAYKLEQVADNIFMLSLLGILGIIFIIIFNYWGK